MSLSIIVAAGLNGEIGRRGGMIWHLPEDLRYFKRVTTGHPVIMGRKTWESLPKRPLPGRQNVVVTRNRGYEAEGALVAASLEEAIMLADRDPFIIGGEEIYRQSLPLADHLYLTRISGECADAEAFFRFPAEEWQLVEESEPVAAEGKPELRFQVYQRRQGR